MAKPRKWNIEERENYQREKGCRHKTRYRLKRLAIRKKSGIAGKRGLVAYRCKFCGWWHLGHGKTAVKKALAR